jgi:hypothetical protein
MEKPGEGLKKVPEPNKKQKLSDETASVDEMMQAGLSRKAEKKALKAEKKKAKKEKKDEKAKSISESNTESKPEVSIPQSTSKDTTHKSSNLPKEPKDKNKKNAKVSEVVPIPEEAIEEAPIPPKEVDEDEPFAASDIEPLDLPGLDDEPQIASNASSPTSAPHSPIFDDAQANPANETASTTTSIASAVPPTEKPKLIKMPKDTTVLRARLAARIAELRAARKADGPDGKPVRTREELIEQRRSKEAQRKAKKKEQRRLQKLEAERIREEQLASNSPMSPLVDLDNDPLNFAFGRVAFGDGAQLSHDLGKVLTQSKKKGPSDPKTALLKLQNEKKRVAGYDDDKKKDVEEKESWLIAKKRAEGQKIHDDEALLKKAVKRKDQQKKKTSKQWGDRVKGVEQTQKERQKKREENLRSRKEDKIIRKMGGKAGKKKPTKGRPGFEGSFGIGSGTRRK